MPYGVERGVCGPTGVRRGPGEVGGKELRGVAPPAAGFGDLAFAYGFAVPAVPSATTDFNESP